MENFNINCWPSYKIRILIITMFLLFSLLTACSIFAPSTESLREVYATQPWQDVDIQIVKGDIIRIEYISGSWTTWYGYHPRVDSEGHEGLGGGKNPNHPLPSAYPGVLIAKIDDGRIHDIGLGAIFRAYKSGKLYLQMNDDVFEDNEGSVRVIIDITHATEEDN